MYEYDLDDLQNFYSNNLISMITISNVIAFTTSQLYSTLEW